MCEAAEGTGTEQRLIDVQMHERARRQHPSTVHKGSWGCGLRIELAMNVTLTANDTNSLLAVLKRGCMRADTMAIHNSRLRSKVLIDDKVLIHHGLQANRGLNTVLRAYWRICGGPLGGFLS